MAFVSSFLGTHSLAATPSSTLRHPRALPAAASPAPARRPSAATLRASTAPAPSDPSSPPPPPVGIGIIGCGRIGQVHAKTISSLPSARLVGVADPFEANGRAVADSFATEWRADWRWLVSHPDVQGIVIGSPTPFHADQIRACAAAGKHIFCEKPISNNLAVIDDSIAAVSAAGVKLLVGFQRRYDSNFLRVRHAVDSGTLGHLRTFHITSRDPAPPPAEYLAKSGGIFLDMARFVTGSDIDEVFVTAAAHDPQAQAAGDSDTAITLLRMKNGAFGTIDNSRTCAYGYDQRIEVFGSRGSATAGNKSGDAVVIRGEDGVVGPLPYGFFMDRYAEAYAGAMTDFVQMIRLGTPSPVTGADGRAPIVAAMAAAKSIAENRPVKLDEVDVVASKV